MRSLLISILSIGLSAAGALCAQQDTQKTPSTPAETQKETPSSTKSPANTQQSSAGSGAATSDPQDTAPKSQSARGTAGSSPRGQSEVSTTGQTSANPPQPSVNQHHHTRHTEAGSKTAGGKDAGAPKALPPPKNLLVVKVQDKEIELKVEGLPKPVWRDQVVPAEFNIEPSSGDSKICKPDSGSVDAKIEEGILTASVPCAINPSSDFTIQITVPKNEYSDHKATFQSESVSVPSPEVTTQSNNGSNSSSPGPAMAQGNSGGGSQQIDTSKFGVPGWLKIILIITTGIVTFLLVVWLLVLRSNRRRNSHSREEDYYRAPEPALSELRSNIRYLQSDISSTQQKAQQALDIALGPAWKKQWNEDSKRFQDRLEKVAGEVQSCTQELRSMIAALSDASSADQSALRRSANSQPSPETAVVALVNQWIAARIENRAQLVELANSIGFDAEFATHLDLSRTFDNNTTFEYPFDSSQNGAWLWIKVANGSEVSAVPIDAGQFTMGYAPNLLYSLFDGMKDSKQGFQFRMFYRSCLLRPVPGKKNLFTLQRKGLVQLENSPAPDLPPPVTFDELRSARRNRIDAAPQNSAAAVAWIRRWKSEVSESLVSQSRQLDAMRSELGNLKSEVYELSSAQSKWQPQDSGEIDRLRVGTASQISAISRRQSELESRLNAALQAMSPEQAVSQPEQGRLASQKTNPPLARKTETAPSCVKAEAPVSGALELPPPVITSKSNEIKQVANWLAALERAATQPGSEPDVAEVPKQETYVRRLRNLAYELQAQNLGEAVSIIHLRRTSQENTFDAHETISGAVPGEVYCAVCRALQTWQLIVCVGKPGEGTIHVLFPFGTLSIGNYFSGYTALIDNLPASTFSTYGISEPARLRLADRENQTYTVIRKMRYVPAVEKGRSS
jgi:hypothetical protein